MQIHTRFTLTKEEIEENIRDYNKHILRDLLRGDLLEILLDNCNVSDIDVQNKINKCMDHAGVFTHSLNHGCDIYNAICNHPHETLPMDLIYTVVHAKGDFKYEIVVVNKQGDKLQIVSGENIQL